MKELLSIKEKAHRYDKALRVVEKLHRSWKETQNRAANEIEEAFPELRESEDERIRKELISLIKETHVTDRYYDLNKMLAWVEKQGEQPDANKEYWRGYREGKQKILEKYATLEKQGEQKPADKVEPKFKVGDWVVQGKMLYQIEKITDLPGNHFQYWTTDGVWFGDGTEAHLWTIQDAKDGDVLAWYDSKCIALFKEEIHDNDSFKSYGFVGACTGVFEDGGFHDIEDAHPATQEQCDLLFQKMKEAGYEWDAEDKVLREIEQKPADTPKFKVGDWCIDYDDSTVFQIVKVLHNTYTYRTNTGEEYSSTHYMLEDDARLWTIQDAKDGDVLADDYSIIIFRKIGNEFWSDVVDFHVGCNYSNQGEINIQSGKSHYGLIKNVTFKPATKEQCDLLFTKMKEDGYEWDAEDKVLKKIEPKQELSEDVATNEYINLGLPSGTLWKTFNEDGYYKFDEAVEKFGDLLPTKEQWEELKDECKWVWKDNGYDVIGPNGNLIFLPAAGYRDGSSVNNVETYGYYWSLSYNDGYHAYYMCFSSDNVLVNYYIRDNEFSVRLVK